MSNRILSYRGQLADDAQDTILLSTKKGEVGYRIIKLQVIGTDPRTVNAEQTLKIYKESQSTIGSTIDFSDNRLLACAYYESENTTASSTDTTIIFDREIFNQDIYVTNYGSSATNYYLELEVIRLSEDQAMVATLKDIRNNS